MNSLNLKIFEIIEFTKYDFLVSDQTNLLEKLLQKHRNDPNRTFLNIHHRRNGYTPVMLASSMCLNHMVELLEKHGADLSTPSLSGKYILEVVDDSSLYTSESLYTKQNCLEVFKDRKRPQREKLISFLIQKLRQSDPVKFENEIGPNALKQALKNYDEIQIQLLFEQENIQFDANAPLFIDYEPICPLIHVVNSIRSSQSRIVEMLIKKRADVNKRDANGKTAIMCVRNLEIAKCLVKHGADVFITDKYGQSCMDYSLTIYNQMNSSITIYFAFIYLEQLFNYYYRTDEANRVKTMFPIQNYHLQALKVIRAELDMSNDLSEFYFIGYFISADFREKILTAEDKNGVDVQQLTSMLVPTKSEAAAAAAADDLEQIFNEIIKQVVVVDEHIDEVNEKNYLVSIVKTSSSSVGVSGRNLIFPMHASLTRKFYELTVEMNKSLLKHTNRMFARNFETSAHEEFESTINEYLSIDRSLVFFVLFCFVVEINLNFLIYYFGMYILPI
jgi:ankyrin repeat protein